MENRSAALPRRGFDVTSSAFLIVAFLTGIAGALQTPTLSLFLTNEVHVRPAMVGFFFTGSAVIGILVSQFLAGRSDRQGDRKQLIVVCCLLGVLACGLTGLCVSLLWPGAIILASRRIPSAGAAMFALLSAGGDVGASLGAFCVGRAADWAQASGTVFAGAAGESGALRAGLLLAAVFPLLCCGVHTALHCTEARGGLPAGSERRHRQ